MKKVVDNKIGELREQRGPRPVSRADLARRVGVSRSYITRLEKGERTPSIEVACRIASYFGCSIEEVFRLS